MQKYLKHHMGFDNPEMHYLAIALILRGGPGGGPGIKLDQWGGRLEMGIHFSFEADELVAVEGTFETRNIEVLLDTNSIIVGRELQQALKHKDCPTHVTASSRREALDCLALAFPQALLECAQKSSRGF